MSKRSKSSILGQFKFKKGTFVVVVLSILFFMIAALGVLLFKSNCRAEPTLKFLSIVYRHGERAPLSTDGLEDPYKNDSFWPDGLGQLLPRGKLNMFKLGKLLRNRYDGFISSKYKATETLVTACANDRIMMSAELLLAGLYPPTGNQIWKADLMWQPIPVHSVPPSSSDMVCVSKPCALLWKEYQYTRVKLQKLLDENHELVSYLAKNTGLKIQLATINHLYNNFLILEEEGLKLPDWTRNVFPHKLKALAQPRELGQFETPKMIQLLSGVLINDILSNMQKKKTAKEFERRLNVYSASDRVMMRLWRGLNISQELVENPKCGATFMIELHEIKGKHRVKILYKNHPSDTSLKVLTIRGCEDDQAAYQDGMCDLHVFSSALEQAIITDFDKECQISH